MRLLVGVLAVWVLAPSAGLAQPESQAKPLNPVGTWGCVLYGNPTLGDERVLMSFAADRSARLARSRAEGSPAWYRVSDWNVAEDILTFDDSRSGRQFEADLRHTTLSGEWHTYSLIGGWWCSRAEGESGPGINILREPDSREGDETRHLIPEVMATPTFPIQAVREAREGRVVLCFVVEPSGEIYKPEFVELSDEIFRATSLDALMRSRYKPWDARREGGARPACRSFIYKLDYVY